MARSVRARGPKAKAATYTESNNSDDDTETEEQEWNENPANRAGRASSSRLSGKAPAKRPIRTDVGDKENAGDGYVPTGAGGSSGSGAKTAVNLKRTETSGRFNDDEAEKRKRRKSAKLLGQQTTMFDGLTDSGPAANGLNAGKQPVQLDSIVPAAPIINVPRDVMNSNFEEWMKMATDNKINANNSWNFALIDYFHDMSLLRNNTDNSINFQRASCTLDGCVKIWTSRVDSVNDETNKLLRGVRDGPSGDSDNDEDQDGADGGPGSQRTQRKGTHRAEATLAKSAAQLRSKKLDLEFSVDPLFKKTCADFDEGGAHGLLMNHLSLGVGIDGGGLRVVFDASDAVAKSGDDEEADEVEPVDTVDLSELRAQFLPDLDGLDHKSIVPSLRDFSFSGNGFSFDDDHNDLYRDDTFAFNQGEFDDEDAGGSDPIGYTQEDVGGRAPIDGGDAQDPAPVQDFFSSDQANQEGYTGDGDFGGDGGFGGDDDFGGDGENGSVVADADHHADGHVQGRGTFVPFDPTKGPNGRDLIMAMVDPDAEGGTMDYFDKNVLKNWAGPEHWKLRKVIRKPIGEQPAAATTKQKREKKEAFKIDFYEPLGMSVKEFSKEKFAPPTRGIGINLPGYSLPSSSKPGKKSKKSKEKEKEREKKEEQLLPDDMHFTSRQLVNLFLKPNFSLKMRGRRVNPKTNAEGEIDENFWAQAAADQAAGRSGEDGNELDVDGQAIPFNTQFFHDDFDDDGDGPGFDDGDDGVGIGSVVPGAEGDEPDLMATLAGTSRRVRPQYVNYAKKAKRVDVRKLKDNIWKSLDIKVPKPTDPNESMDVDDGDQVGLTDPSEHRMFDGVVSNLRKTYPKDKMQDISTSFCFICLLHLANERGLKIEVGESPEAEDEGEPEEGDNRVGDLWSLKIFRDPNAVHSA